MHETYWRCLPKPRPSRPFRMTDSSISDQQSQQPQQQQHPKPQPPSPTQGKQHYPPEWFTWSKLFKILTRQGTQEEIAQYVQAKSIESEERDCTQCEAWRDYWFQYSPNVRFLQQEIRKVGGRVDSHNVVCRRCDSLKSTGPSKGGFSTRYGIMLCANHLGRRGELEDTLAHEMIHMYDYFRFQYNPNDLRHLACTEVSESTIRGLSVPLIVGANFEKHIGPGSYAQRKL